MAGTTQIQPTTETTEPEFAPSQYTQPLDFYFLHHVDPIEATLRVDVLGANLSHTFTHSRAKSYSNRRTNVADALGRKTAGFIALVAPKSDAEKCNERIPLAWAQSGHGFGSMGDILDSTASVLSNKVWTKRVLSVAKVLGLGMGNLFDCMGQSRQARDREALRGIFQGSHVEVKLAVFGIVVLLHMFGITTTPHHITRSRLKRLRGMRLEGGGRPVLEVYFSRKNCGKCGLLVQKLEDLTGVAIRLCWRDRLIKKTYTLLKLRKRPGRPAVDAAQSDEDVLDEVDLAESDAIEISDDETAYDEEDGDSAGAIDLTTPPPSSPPQNDTANDQADDFIDGLAYCVGQMEQSPDIARAAIVDLADRIHRHKRNSNTHDGGGGSGASISKPLPATPETHAPPWMVTGTDVPEARESPPSPSVGRDLRSFAFGGFARGRGGRSQHGRLRSPRGYAMQIGERMRVS